MILFKKINLLRMTLIIVLCAFAYDLSAQNHYWKPVGFNRVDDKISCYTQFNKELYIAHGKSADKISYISRLINNTWVDYCSVKININQINCIVFFQNTLYLGGSFQSYESDINKIMIIKYETNQWTALGSQHIRNLIGPVYVNKMENYLGKLLIGGYFDAIGPFQNANSIASWDGTSFSVYGTGIKYIDSVMELPGVVKDICAMPFSKYPDATILGDFFKADTNWVAYSTILFNGIFAPTYYAENQVYKTISHKDVYAANVFTPTDTFNLTVHFRKTGLSNYFYEIRAVNGKNNLYNNLFSFAVPFLLKTVNYLNGKLYFAGDFYIPNEQHFFSFKLSNLKADSFNNQNIELIPFSRVMDSIHYLLNQDDRLIAIGNFHDKNGLDLYNIAWYDSTGSTFVGMNTIANENNMRVYPNPASNKLIIEYSNPIAVNNVFAIYSVDGRIILSGSLKKIETEIDVSTFSEGIYILKTQQGYNRFYIMRN